jgi:hypothetical protein
VIYPSTAIVHRRRCPACRGSGLAAGAGSCNRCGGDRYLEGRPYDPPRPCQICGRRFSPVWNATARQKVCCTLCRGVGARLCRLCGARIVAQARVPDGRPRVYCTRCRPVRRSYARPGSVG